jgi:nitrate/TMAO reductase-like tetraheme cytochrome c subunit
MTMFPKDAPVRLKGKALEALRREVWERDKESCVRCGRWVRLEGGYWDSMHHAHKQGRGANGPDTPENTEAACIFCHIGIEHSYGRTGMKPVRAKEIE